MHNWRVAGPILYPTTRWIATLGHSTIEGASQWKMRVQSSDKKDALGWIASKDMCHELIGTSHGSIRRTFQANLLENSGPGRILRL
jgi:hypothetical protein